MGRRIAISSLINQISVAIVENGHLAEFFIERDNQQRTVGNLYKGEVENVLPGMEAAFVDIGLERNAFIYVSDVSRGNQNIEEVLHKGQPLLVQVTKEPAGSKGARVTTRLALPGRFMVLMPYENSIGVSRKIEQEAERERLKNLARDLKPQDMGVIVRTVAEGQSEKELAKDLRYLTNLWNRIEGKVKSAQAPALVYQDHDLIYRIIRDLFTEEVEEIIVDQPELYRKIRDTMVQLNIVGDCKVTHYQGKVSLFEQLGVQKELDKARQNRVWLDSGGYLIIDETEALVVIDVNTGKYVGSKDLAATVLRTNLEAAAEIAKQLRLRNIGGIVIIDFIDMDNSADRQQVVDALEEALKQDKTKTHVLGFTQLGLVELTRKKEKKKLTDILERPCPSCGGSGRVISEETLAFNLAHEAFSVAKEAEVEAMLIECHPSVASFLIGNGGINLANLEESTGKKVFVRGSESFEREDSRIRSGPRGKVEKLAYPVQTGQQLTLVVESVHQNYPGHGIGKVEGYIIDIADAEELVGQKVMVEVTQVNKTHAQARVVKILN